MARRSGSYKFQKRQKELAKKQKKQEKLDRRKSKDSPGDDDLPPADQEPSGPLPSGD